MWNLHQLESEMPKATVTYHAPKGDAKVCEMFGHTFYDGQAQEVEVDDRELGKLKGNSLFTMAGDPKPEPPKEPPHAKEPPPDHDKKHK
jgi:hypothetical protein